MLRCPDCGTRNDASGACPRHGNASHGQSIEPTAPPPPEVPGFRVDRLLATGGQGSIFRACREADLRAACIKVARPIGAAACSAWTREHTLQRRAGPELAPEVFAEGSMPGGDRWLAMAFVEGDTLATMLRARPAPWACEDVAVVLEPILATLAGLHRRGVVHGDLKPENVIVAGNRAVLVDFGSATLVDDDDPPLVAGTAEYLAPERCATPPRSRLASDLYAIATMVQELVTGAPPFWGAEEAVAEGHRSRRPPALVRFGLPPALADVMRRALAKDPFHRFPDADALAAAMLAALRSAGSQLATPLRVPAESVHATGHTRARAALVWFHSHATAADVHERLAPHRGVLAHARKGAMVAAFTPDSARNPVVAALAAARALVADGACERALVDVELVGLHTAGPTTRVLSPRFAFAARYPDDADPPGVLFTKAAVELLHGTPTLPLPHRSDRFAATDEDAWALASEAATETTMHGRDDVLAALREAASVAGIGRPTLATVTGEGGSGRTRVAQALAQALAQVGDTRVVAVRAPESSGPTLVGCIPLLLKALLELPTAIPSDPRAVLGARLGMPAASVPIGLLLALEWADADDPDVQSMRAAPGAIRSSVAVAVAELLVRESANRPLAIVVDDADRVETALLDAFESATLAEGGARLFICVVARSGFARDRTAWSSRAAHALTLELAPLAMDSTAELVRELLRPAMNIPADAIDVIHRRTRGLPLLVVELARVLRSAGALRRVPGGTGWTFASEVLHRLPDLPIAEWMAQREIDRLPRALARHAAVLAAMGPSTDPHTLELTLQHLELAGTTAPTDLDPEVALHRLVTAGVLRRDGESLLFRHAALRDHAAGTLDGDTRRSLHAAAHAVLVDDSAHSSARLAELIHHAVGAGMSIHAAAHAIALAADASRRHAYLEAEHCYGIALEHLDTHADDAIAALHGRGLMRFRLGRYEDARADLQRVISEDHDTSARRIDALLDAATVEDWCEDYEHAESLVDAAQELGGAGAEPLHCARLALARGRVAFRRSRIDDAIAELADAAARGEALGDAGYETRVISLLLLAPLLGMTGHADRSLPLFDTLFALCREHSDRIHLATAFLNRPFVWIETQQFDKLREDLEHVISLSRSVGFPLLESRARYNLGEIAYLQGEFDEAERHAATVVELQRQLGGDNQRVLVTELLAARSRARRGELGDAQAIIASIRGRQAEARADVRGGFELLPSDEILCRMVELVCDGSDAGAWAELVARSEQDSVQQEHIEVLELAGLAAARRGANDEAYVALERALALTDTTPTMLRPRIEAALAELPRRASTG